MKILHKVTIVPWLKSQVQVIATEPIKKGEVVMAEEPLVSRDLQVYGLPLMLEMLLSNKIKLEEFKSWDLFYEKKKYEQTENINQLVKIEQKFDITHKEFKKLWSLVNTNALDSNGISGLFRVMSRVNHDCNPNCGLEGDFKLVAIRDIALYEPITYNYLRDNMTVIVYGKEVEVKTNLLMRNASLYLHGFTCLCNRCKLMRRPNMISRVETLIKKTEGIVRSDSW